MVISIIGIALSVILILFLLASCMVASHADKHSQRESNTKGEAITPKTLHPTILV